MIKLIFILFISVPFALLGYNFGYKRKSLSKLDLLKSRIYEVQEQNAGALNILENRLSAEKKELVKPVIDILK